MISPLRANQREAEHAENIACLRMQLREAGVLYFFFFFSSSRLDAGYFVGSRPSDNSAHYWKKQS